MDSIEWAAWVTAIATVALAAIAIIAGVQAKATLAAAKADSRARTRPYVFVDLLPGAYGVGSADLIIRNTGQSSALDVRVTFTPDPASGEDDVLVNLVRRAVAKPFDLPPGTYKRWVWILGSSEAERRIGMPDRVETVVAYRGGDAMKDRYTDDYVLNAETIWAGPLPHVGPEPHSGMDKDLRKIYLALQEIARNVRMTTYDR